MTSSLHFTLHPPLFPSLSQLAEEHGFIALLGVAEEDTLSPRERECGIEVRCSS